MTEFVNFAYEEVNCLKSTQGADFVQGIQDFVLNTGTRVFLPQKSYFVMDATLTGAVADAPPALAEDIAFAFDAPNMAYSQAYFLAAGATISSITNLSQQVSALHHRVFRPNTWIKTIGDGAFVLNPDHQARLVATSRALVNDATAGTVVGSVPILAGSPDGIAQLSLAADDSGAAPTISVAAGAGGALVGANTHFTRDLVGAYVYGGADGASGNINQYLGQVKTIASITTGTMVCGVDTAGHTANYYFVKQGGSYGNFGKNITRMLFQPPLSIFDYKGYLSGGEFRFQLSPNVNYVTSMIESSKSLTVGVGGAPGRVNVVINGVRFYAATAELTVQIPPGIKNLHMWELLCQSKPMTSNSMNFVFTVPSSTIVLHAFLQSNLAGTNTKYPPSAFKAKFGSELGLQSIQISYADKTVPKTQWRSDFNLSGGGAINTSNTNLIQQLYYQRQLELGRDDKEGGVESFTDFLKLGPIWSFAFERDFQNRCTEAQVQVTYTKAVNGPSTFALPATAGNDGFDTTSIFYLVAEYRKTAEITSANGAITQVRMANT